MDESPTPPVTDGSEPLKAMIALRVLLLALIAISLLRGQVNTFDAAPPGIMESGAPSFVIHSPDAIGLRSAPTGLSLLKDGRILVVAGMELATGDGTRWEVSQIEYKGQGPSTQTVIVDPEGRLYTGLGTDFVELIQQEDGRWHAEKRVSTNPSDEARALNAGKATKTSQGWFWHNTSGALIRWQPGSWPSYLGSLNSVDHIFVHQDQVYVSDRADGSLHRVGIKKLEPVLQKELCLPANTIYASVPFTEGKTLVGTQTRGLMLFDGKTLTPFKGESALFDGRRINDLCRLDETSYAALVEQLGLVIFSKEGRILQTLTQMLDDRLARGQRIIQGRDGLLWLLLADGVARVQYPSKISHMESLSETGVTIALPFRHKGALWLLAEGRLQKAHYSSDGRLERFRISSPVDEYVFAFSFSDSRLCAGTGAGLMILEGNEWKFAAPGIRNARLLPRKPGETRELYAARGELGYLDTKSWPWTAERHPVNGLTENYGAYRDSQGRIWLELGAGKVGLIEADNLASGCRILGNEEGLPSSWVQIFSLNESVRFNAGNLVWRYDETKRRFVRDSAFYERYGYTLVQGRPARDPSGRLWITADGRVDIVDDSGPGAPRIVEENVAPGMQPYYFTFETGGATWLHENGKLARYDPNVPPCLPHSPDCLITRVILSPGNRHLTPGDPPLSRLDHDESSLSVHFMAPANPFLQNVSFEMMLEGSSLSWVPIGSSGSTLLNQLKEGSYVLHARALASGKAGKEARMEFKVRPPWYRSPLAYVLYVCGAVGLVLTISWSVTALERREKRRLALLVGQRTAELRDLNQKLLRQIDETKKSEENVRRLNEELEIRVQQRTEDLNQARERLVESNRELEAFSYSVSHDLRAPLRNINGFGEILRKRCAGKLDATSDHYIEVLCTESIRLGQLIESLLGFSKLTRTELKKIPVDLRSIADKVREELSHTCKDREIIWDFSQVPLVEADPTLLRQVLANLLGNACKFTKERHPARIEFGCRQQDSASAEFTFFVRDNGAGFDEKYKDRLFGVFQRLHKQSEFEGTGIGLANVRRIISRHGGRVWAESRTGEGACFYFTLPWRARDA